MLKIGLAISLILLPLQASAFCGSAENLDGCGQDYKDSAATDNVNREENDGEFKNISANENAAENEATDFSAGKNDSWSLEKAIFGSSDFADDGPPRW